LMYLMVINFLMAHEAAHISDGHLGYLFSKDNKIKTFDDVEINLERQCLEVYSDVFATKYCLQMWINFANQKHLLIPHKLSSPDKVFGVYVFSLYFLIRVLTTSTPVNQSIESDFKRKHPVSAFRWRLIIETLYYDLFNGGLINDSFRDYYTKFIDNHLFAFEQCLRNISVYEDDGFDSEYNRTTKYKNFGYQESLRKEYQSLSPLLQPFRTTNNFPF